MTRVPVSQPCPSVSQDTAKTTQSDRVPVSLSIDTGHGHGGFENISHPATLPERVPVSHPAFIAADLNCQQCGPVILCPHV
jgi:hypothetical protein